MKINNAFADVEAAASDCEPHYGRRVEADRSWTVHHVFTGVPARIDGVTMEGLDRSDATDVMLSLNRRSAARKRARNASSRPSPTATAVGAFH